MRRDLVRLSVDPPLGGPQYRFWGSVCPPKERAPLMATTDPKSDGDVSIIRLYDPIDSWGEPYGVSAKEFQQVLDTVETPEIRLHINSPGGEVWEGIAILNQLRAHPAKVTAVVDGIAASAASFIATGLDETVMARQSQMMIHDASGLCIGQARDMHDFADVLDKISDNIASVYAEKSGGTVADWRAAMLAESWYNADEAVAAGLADTVDTGREAAPTDRFDLSGIGSRYGSREAAPTPPIPLVPAATGPSALVGRRHRMTARRHGLPV